MKKGKKRKLVEAEDVFGESVETETLFQSFKVLMEDLIARRAARCINATEGGLGLQGTDIMTLRDALDGYGLPEATDIKGKIREACQEETQIDFPRLQRNLAEAQKHADDIIRDSEKVLVDVRRSRKLIKRKGLASDQYPKVSARMEKRTAKVREKERFLGMLGEYALGLELYMSSQTIIDIDSIEDPYERFKKQIARAGVYYRGLLRVLKPFAKGVKTLRERINGFVDLKERPFPSAVSHLQGLTRYKKLGMYGRAVVHGEAVLHGQPSNIEARLHLAEIALWQHQPTLAQAYLEPLCHNEKRSARLHSLLAECQEKVKAWDEKVQAALKEYRPPHPLDNANFYYRLGSYDQAIERYRQLITSTPSWEAFYHLAHALIAKEDRDQAVLMLEEALSIAPEQAVLYRDLGLMAVDNGQDDLAERFWLQALQFDQNDPRLYELLSQHYLRRKEFSKAMPMIEALAQLCPDRDAGLNQLAAFYHRVVQEIQAPGPAVSYPETAAAPESR